ncbi:serine hydrolase [Longispora fulva]|uniref:CubicO group peptidase (Beta-lactamase class C family) n=1 Tax=Longispora fulva TaxID=619741 RepID=A0A8J7GNZ5_9ACTN|nr:serine hydrolase domain-containing protein [Longispora fulva]MBG6138575.1 CubicO group peptidase (beta-lactamase class C family) [Longispora fulva]GIG62320.1 serine hydrolase [Longispora fulva]
MKELERRVRGAQAEGRVPAVQAAVVRADRPDWTFAVGGSGTDRPLDDASQFRIGSVTKTFTAVLALQARDAGLLDLDDPVGKHLRLGAHGEHTYRRLLSHTSGIQREPDGDVWDTLNVPDIDTLLTELHRAEQVLPSARRFHYSNLGLALVGQAVATLRGGTWAEVLTDLVLTPLGLTGVTVQPTDTAVTGYQVDAYSDHARVEPRLESGGIAPAAQLWGTARDLARWAAFLADPASVDPTGSVLAEATMEEARWPVTTSDAEAWLAAFGLGLIVVPQGDRVVHVGHDGAMPGFLAAAYGRRGPGAPRGMGAATLGSAGNGAVVLELAHELLGAAVEADPADVEPWSPAGPVPEEFRSVLGRWWGEGFEHVFRWEDGRLVARAAGVPVDRAPAVFEPRSVDVLRTVSGREVGELLRLTRDASGAVVAMHWATYRFSRDQQDFTGGSFS